MGIINIQCILKRLKCWILYLFRMFEEAKDLWASGTVSRYGHIWVITCTYFTKLGWMILWYFCTGAFWARVFWLLNEDSWSICLVLTHWSHCLSNLDQTWMDGASSWKTCIVETMYQKYRASLRFETRL